MKRWLPLPIFSLCALLGCAPAIAPLPPLTMPIPDRPQEYRVVPVKWQANTVLTHNLHNFREVRIENQVETAEEHHAIRLSVVERPARGHVRFRIAYDGTALGDFLRDEQGRFVDAFPSNAENTFFQMYIYSAGDAAMGELASKTLRRNEPVRVTLPFAPYAQFLPPETQGIFAEGVEIEVTFKGYVRLGATDAISITKTLNPLKTPFYIPAKGKRLAAWLDDVSVVEQSYYDATRGYTLVTHRETFMMLRVAGRAVYDRSIQHEALDRTRSSGF